MVPAYFSYNFYHNFNIKLNAYDKTGVEMEAMTAVSISLLTVYDMCKGIDKGMIINNIILTKKTGGASGTWEKVK